MYELNKYGKIIISHNERDTEYYYGCVVEANSRTGVLKLYVVDWRDREKEPRQFYEILAPMSKTLIKFKNDIGVSQ